MKKSALRSSIDATFFNGITDVIMKSLTTGPLLTAYVFSLGLSNVILGFLQSLFSLSSLEHLPISYLLEKGIRPKKIACFCFLAGLPFLLLVALSFFISNGGQYIFIISYTAFLIMIGIIGGAFWPWCKKIVPSSLLTPFFAHRIKYILMVKVTTIILATILISFFSQNSSNKNEWIYACIILIAFFVGCFYAYTLFWMPDVKLECKKDLSFLKKFKFVMTNKSFISFFLNLGLANFSFSFFSPFTIAFLLSKLNIPVSNSMFFFVISSFFDIMFIDLWKKYSLKNGVAKMLSLAFFSFILVTFVFIYLAFWHANIYYFLPLAFILIGLGNAGINLGISDSSVSHVPHENSSVYISVLNIGRFGFSGLGTFLAGITLEALSKFTTNNYGLFFIICNILFLCSCIFIKKLKHISQ